MNSFINAFKKMFKNDMRFRFAIITLAFLLAFVVLSFFFTL